jgi:hypothetical protein
MADGIRTESRGGAAHTPWIKKHLRECDAEPSSKKVPHLQEALNRKAKAAYGFR